MIKAFCVIVYLLMNITGAGAAENWTETKSDHFIVFSQKASEKFVESVSVRAEELYQKTTTVLGITRYEGWVWGERVKIYIYDSAEDFKKASGYEWSAGEVSTDTKTIATYPSARGFFDSVLPHELGHIIFHEFVGPRADVPMWLSEGVAMYLEDGQRYGAADAVRQAIEDGRFISLADLASMELTHDSERSLVDLFYAEAANVVAFLLQDGEEYRFVRLCRELQEGTRFEAALKSAYMKYQTIQDLDQAWRSSL